jgi:hypothetical protein
MVAEQAAPQPARIVSDTTTVSAHFKMVFLSVFGLTAGLILVRVAVAIFLGVPNDGVKEAMTMCTLLANAGFGAILGLIGGKAV